MNAVVGTWVVLDPKVGGWLLNPDHPPLTFLQTALTLKAPLPKVSRQNVSYLSYIDLLKIQMHFDITLHTFQESSPGLAPEDELWSDLECLSNTTAFLHTLLTQHRLWAIYIHLEMRLLPSLAGTVLMHTECVFFYLPVIKEVLNH